MVAREGPLTGHANNIFVCLFVFERCLFIFEREKERGAHAGAGAPQRGAGEGRRERRDRGSKAGSVPTAESPMRDSDS